MIKVKLPNGAIKSYQSEITPLEIAGDISTSLQKKALVAKVDEELWDIKRSISKDCKLEILTKENLETLQVLRHDAAHVLAEAVLDLYPDTQITIGPAIEDGFYYDFYRKISFTPEDLIIIEEKMHEIVDRNEVIQREVWDRLDALKFFKKNNEKFKIELVNDIPEDQKITFYRQGKFIDLCRGPHFQSTKHFKYEVSKNLQN